MKLEIAVTVVGLCLLAALAWAPALILAGWGAVRLADRRARARATDCPPERGDA